MFNRNILARLQQLQKQRQEQSFLNVQSLYNLGFPIDQYVQLGSVTAEQYKQITGKDYVEASTSTSAGASESTSTDASQA
ncbi:XkdX family protein [Limosilactobacillus ingluviei]|uniref:XkdX family protein n=1 Tax=Limosilactobacillus ingluviei TaxID=148604 RepID=UPI0002DF0791|nr:XkdX family protein [Limosilactobacillus ingluviei]